MAGIGWIGLFGVEASWCLVGSAGLRARGCLEAGASGGIGGWGGGKRVLGGVQAEVGAWWRLGGVADGWWGSCGLSGAVSGGGKRVLGGTLGAGKLALGLPGGAWWWDWQLGVGLSVLKLGLLGQAGWWILLGVEAFDCGFLGSWCLGASCIWASRGKPCCGFEPQSHPLSEGSGGPNFIQARKLRASCGSCWLTCF